MRFLVMRHGETDANQQEIMVGRTDIPLNDNGRDEAEKAAEVFRDVRISAIYTSPLKRAVETAEIIAKCHGDAGFNIRDELNEWDAGLAAGLPHGDIRYRECQMAVFERYPGGESRADIIARVYPVIRNLIREYMEDACVLIVTHGDICKIIDSFFRNISDLELETEGWATCEFREYWDNFQL